MTQFVASMVLSHVNSAELARTFMEELLLTFSICLIVVIDNDVKFKAVFEYMAKSLSIRLHRVGMQYYKVISMERYHNFINHNTKIISSTRQTHKCFVEVGHISTYARNAIPIDKTDIIQSIPTIGRPPRFPMNVSISVLPTPITETAKATVRYLLHISKDAYFAKDLVIWLVEERRELHRERVNTGNKGVTYKVNNMVMARVQVKSFSADVVTGKLSIEVR